MFTENKTHNDSNRIQNRNICLLIYKERRKPPRQNTTEGDCSKSLELHIKKELIIVSHRLDEVIANKVLFN